MSVLAHVARSAGERGATHALAYILNRHPRTLLAFVELLGAAGVQFNPLHHVEPERGQGGNLPDMTIYDAQGPHRRPRVLVENKFDADLKEGQPVCYLNMLPEDGSTGLLFIVPGDRVKEIWRQLKTRCQDVDPALGPDAVEGRVRWVQVGARTMLITDWQNLLGTLERAAQGEEARCDILEFRQLVETLEGLEVFQPVGAEEITNVDVAQRMMNYIDLLNSICYRLPHENTGITCGKPVTDVKKYRSIHRSLEWDGNNVGWLAVSFYVWQKSGGVTPLWWWMAPAPLNGQKYNPNEKTFDVIEKRIPGVYVSDIMGPEQDGNKFIPIRVKFGVEREELVDDAIRQIRAIQAEFEQRA